MAQLGQYFRIEEWIGQLIWTLLLGGAFILLTYLVGRERMESLKMWAIAIAACLIIAVFIVTAVRVITEANRPSTELRPNFKVLIGDNWSVGESKDDKGRSGATIVVYLEVLNSGSDSVISKITAEIRLVDGTRFPARMMKMSDKSVSLNAPEIQDRLKPENSLMLRTYERGIPRGARGAGWVVAHFDGMPVDKITQTGSRITYVVFDVVGNPYSGDFTFPAVLSPDITVLPKVNEWTVTPSLPPGNPSGSRSP